MGTSDRGLRSQPDVHCYLNAEQMSRGHVCESSWDPVCGGQGLPAVWLWLWEMVGRWGG